MEKNTAKSKNSAVSRVIFVICMVLVCAVLGLAAWGIATAHTKQPQTSGQAVQEYLASLAVGDFQQINRDSGFSPSALCGWQDYDAYLRQTYGNDFEPLTLSEPQAADDGSQVYTVSRGDAPLASIHVEQATNGDGWRVFTDIGEAYLPYAIVAPAHLQVTVNGQALSPDDVIDTQVVSGYEILSPDVDTPDILTYEILPLLSRPEVAAANAEGRQGQVTWDENARQVIIQMPVQEEGLEAVALDTFILYADYATGEIDFEGLEPVLLPGSDLYNSLAEPDGQYDGLIIESVGIRDMKEWAEDAFSTVVDFQILDLDADDEDEDVPAESATFTLYFIQMEEAWLLVGLSAAA